MQQKSTTEKKKKPYVSTSGSKATLPKKKIISAKQSVTPERPSQAQQSNSQNQNQRHRQQNYITNTSYGGFNLVLPFSQAQQPNTEEKAVKDPLLSMSQQLTEIGQQKQSRNSNIAGVDLNKSSSDLLSASKTELQRQSSIEYLALKEISDNLQAKLEVMST